MTAETIGIGGTEVSCTVLCAATHPGQLGYGIIISP